MPRPSAYPRRPRTLLGRLSMCLDPSDCFHTTPRMETRFATDKTTGEANLFPLRGRALRCTLIPVLPFAGLRNAHQRGTSGCASSDRATGAASQSCLTMRAPAGVSDPWQSPRRAVHSRRDAGNSLSIHATTSTAGAASLAGATTAGADSRWLHAVCRCRRPVPRVLSRLGSAAAGSE